jgi:hypothetical protein
MSWKTNVFAVALLALIASSVTAGDAEARRTNDDAAVGVCVRSNVVSVTEPSDKELIEKQKTCPVTDQPLGSMGKPVKVVVKERTVFLCCAGCTKKLLADPDKYIKKLDEKK